MSAGAPAGSADPTAPINHLSSVLFSFLFVVNVDLCLSTLIRSVQCSAPGLLIQKPSHTLIHNLFATVHTLNSEVTKKFPHLPKICPKLIR